jgi:hypothetical protein
MTIFGIILELKKVLIQVNISTYLPCNISYEGEKNISSNIPKFIHGTEAIN